jgi:hypothetical protein
MTVTLYLGVETAAAILGAGLNPERQAIGRRQRGEVPPTQNIKSL